MKIGETTMLANDYGSIYDRNEIHPTAIIGENVLMGNGNVIGAYTIIDGNTIIGDNNIIMSHVVIGTDPEHKDFWLKQNCGVTIGNKNVIREFVTINGGTFKPTILYNDCILLRGSHVGHDSLLQERVTLSCNVLIGGESLIMRGVNMGLGSMCHQRSIIPQDCMIGMNTVITKTTFLIPFGKYVGVPAKYIGENTYKTKNMKTEEITNLRNEFEQFKQKLEDAGN